MIRFEKEAPTEQGSGASCTFEGSPVTRVEIESAADRVEILTAAQREIQVEFIDKAGKPIHDERKLCTDRSGGTLRVWIQYPLSLLSWHKAGILRVRLSSSNDFQVHVVSASGAVHVHGVCTRDLSLSAASGDVIVQNCRAYGELSMRTQSGRARLDEAEADSTAIRTASGSIETKRLVSSSLQTKTASGECRLRVHGAASVRCESKSGAIELSGETRKLEMSAASGSLRAVVADLEEASINTASGRVDLDILAPAACRNVNVQTASGSVHLTLPHSVCPHMSFLSASGRLHFRASDFSSAGAQVPVQVTTVSGYLSVRPS